MASKSSVATRQEAERREHEWLSPLACFSDQHGARPEPEAPDPYRTAFVRDRDRIVHCGAFRRLKDKTQVFVIDEGDFYRTRLTHTLEVAQMARFLCSALRLNESLGEALALVHDIGHPPFGHEGERILGERAGVSFNHNAQALRIVDVLESPYPDRQGLNLTQVLRRSILKHGGEAGRGAPATPGLVLEAQATDLADSTAYQHHDLEDGLRAGILSEPELAELEIWRCVLAEEPAQPKPAGRAGSRSAGARRKDLLSRILKASLHDIVSHSQRLLEATTAREASDVMQQAARLVSFSAERGSQHRQLGAFLLERFYRHPRVLRSAATAREAIAVIVEHYHAHPDELPADYRGRREAEGLGRTVCDYVAGMTDRFAMEESRRLAQARSVHTAPALDAQSAAESEARVAQLEQHIGYRFHDKRLAGTALTHASARSDVRAPNERLEYLGDSVLGLCVARDLYQRFTDRDEGELSRIRGAVVSRHALRRVAEGWGLVDLLTMNASVRTAGEVPDSIVADAVEAVLGAVFLDGGLPAVARIVQSDFGPLIEAASDRRRHGNHKSALQHFTQGESGETPEYRVLSEEGPDHAKVFRVAAMIGNRELAVASGKNKRQAEQRAARLALLRLRSEALGDSSPPHDADPDPEADPETWLPEDGNPPGAADGAAR
ncbi:MAG: ribonuclease III [Planctomycetota bacterium]